VTNEEFKAWWASKSIGGATPEQRRAWREFVDVFDREHNLHSNMIIAIPKHARPQFIAGFALIFG
jgi:hypothetical protein